MLAPSSPRPLALTDSEITTIMAAARVLAVADRDAFLHAVATALATLPAVGDGIVARVCREVQQRYWRAPELHERPGKYARWKPNNMYQVEVAHIADV